MKSNEQRAKKAAIAVTVGLLSYDEVYDVILDELNAATGEKNTRIKALNDALKPFAEKYEKEMSIGSDDTAAGYNDEKIYIHVNNLRRAAKVYKEG